MPQSRRVIITGTNKAGKSVVAEEVHAALTGPGNRRTTFRSAARQ